MAIYYCSPGGVSMQGLLWIILVVWLMLLISLLATTADYYFVPPLEYLSFDMLKLSPEVAGITLLALGNGAPDVFGAMAGINGQDDFQVVLGALLGASIFISSVVLGCVLLAVRSTSVDKPTFQRDVVAYLLTVVVIVAIAHDGKVSIYEAIGLLLCYVIYVAVVVVRSRQAAAAQRRREAQRGPGGVHSYDDGLLGEGGNGNGNGLDETRHSVVSVHSHGHVFVGKLEGGGLLPGGGGGDDDARKESFYYDDAASEGGDIGASIGNGNNHRSASTGSAYVDLLGSPLATTDHSQHSSRVRTRTFDSHATGLSSSRHGGGNGGGGNGGGGEPLAGLEWYAVQQPSAGGGAGGGLAARALAVVFRVQAALELPFTLLRWASCPAVDGSWDGKRRAVAVAFPIGFPQVVLLDAFGWDGFGFDMGGFPVWALLLLLGGAVSALVFAATAGTVGAGGGEGAGDGDGAGAFNYNALAGEGGAGPGGDYRHPSKERAVSSATADTTVADNKKPLPRIYPFLTLGAFASAVVWMDLIANEAVALMESLGVMLHISTSILGLTVLALGNSVGDLIADLAVAKAGQGRMAISTCFGSPLLNDILGLGIALLITTATSFPKEFHGDISTDLYVAWGFLAVSLVSSLVVFHSYGYEPPRKFAYWLFAIYALFLVSSIALALGVFA
jgi:Ca2+/Na+ antiporter